MLEPSAIKRYMLSLSARGCNTQTVNIHARVIRNFLNYCKRDRLLDDNPFDRVKLPKVDRDIKDALTAQEIKIILKAANSRAAYARDLRRFATYAGVLALQQVTLADLQGFADSLSDLSPNSRKRVISAVKSLLSFAFKIGYLRFNVGAALRAPKAKGP